MSIPDWLQRPAHRALRDLHGNDRVPLRVDPDSESVIVRQDRGLARNGVWIGESRGEDLTAQIADQLERVTARGGRVRGGRVRSLATRSQGVCNGVAGNR